MVDMIPHIDQPGMREVATPLFGQPGQSRGNDFERSGRRPKVIPAKLENGTYVTDYTQDMVTYTSVTTLTGMVGSGHAIAKAKVRKVAVAAYQFPEFAYLATKDPKEDRGEIDDAVSKLLTRYGDAVAADNGNIVHSFLNVPFDTVYMPQEIKNDIEETNKLFKRKGFTKEGHEIRVVDDRRECAGTLDMLIRLPSGFRFTDSRTGEVVDLSGKVVVGDVKTGQWFYPLSWAVQIAYYASGMRYNVKTGERTPIHPDLDTRYGVIIWIPYGREEPRAVIVDLTIGNILGDMICLWHGQGSKGQRIISECPDLSEYCSTCSQGGHTCPGCGIDIDHDHYACGPCDARVRLEECVSVDMLRDVWFNGLTEEQRTEESAAIVRAIMQRLSGG